MRLTAWQAAQATYPVLCYRTPWVTARSDLLWRNDVSHVLRNGLFVHLLGRMLQSNQIAARRFRGLAGRIMTKLCLVRSYEELTLLCETFNTSCIEFLDKLHTLIVRRNLE